jgi:hypothetical protein
MGTIRSFTDLIAWQEGNEIVAIISTIIKNASLASKK